MATLAKRCGDLTTLSLSCCTQITDAGLEKLARGCGQLTSLHLGACTHVTDAGLDNLAEGCRQLIKLKLWGCIKITDAGLTRLVSKCEQITNLDVSRDCIHVTDRVAHEHPHIYISFDASKSQVVIDCE